MKITSDPNGASSRRIETGQYYCHLGWALFWSGLLILFWLAMMALFSRQGAWNQTSAGLMATYTFFFFFQVYYTVRNSNRPFITLNTDRFLVGNPLVSILYADIERYSFDPDLRKSRSKVAFMLWPRNNASIPEINGRGPVNLKNGNIVCRRIRLGRMVTAGEFFDDFAARLQAAGAVDVLAGQKNLIKMNTATGEALVMPKGFWASLIIGFGQVDNREDAKWFCFRLGTVIAVFLGLEIRALIGLFERLGTDFDLITWVLGPFFALPLFLTMVAAVIQGGLIKTLGRTKAVARYMEQAGEIKKIILGATVGVMLCALAGFVFLVALTLLRQFF